LGAAFYSKINASNDIYSLTPLRAELRWEIHFNEFIVLHFYGGIQYNWIRTTENAVYESTYNAYQGVQVIAGTGLMFNIGPQWFVRTDIGHDRAALGMGLRW
jgi:hypothetical protein